MEGFREGYSFCAKNLGAFLASELGYEYILDVENAIEQLKQLLNNFEGYKTLVSALKGDIAEFWHGGTFNINAAIRCSVNRAFIDRSNEFASPDITTNFGQSISSKYYQSAIDSAKQQAKSVFERFKEYQAQGGKESQNEFLSKRGYDSQKILNDPIYVGQIRIIPKGQLEEATAWLQKKIIEEGSKRPEQVLRYKETLKMLTDKIKDNKGAESIPLTKEDAEFLARLAKEGKITNDILKKMGISTEELIKFEHILKPAFKAGLSAAMITIVLQIAPEIYKSLSYLIKYGYLDERQFQKVGFAALNGASEGFIRGSVAAGITAACKAGLWGATLKEVDSTIVGALTSVTINTMKNAFYVATNKMQKRELANELIRDMFVSTCSLVIGGTMQGAVQIPILGFMLGSFIGSVIGSFAYNIGQNAILSFCVDTGFTMFGLVDQSYKLPDEVLKYLGVKLFDYERFSYGEFQYNEFKYKEFQYKKSEYETCSIKILRRGVIDVQQIGYV